jgi:hypothetical protein
MSGKKRKGSKEDMGKLNKIIAILVIILNITD